MQRKVIYTCYTGGYDSLKQPLTIYEDYDYICFTDNVTAKQNGVWEMRPIPYENTDNTRRARYIKHNPHIILPDYEYSVWIDSNIQIVDEYLKSRVDLLITEGSKMAHITHPRRGCIYVEAIKCIRKNNDKNILIYNFIKKISSEGFPKNYGLSETNIIYRKHNDDTIKTVSQEWWNNITTYSRRDQLSFYYVLWKLDVKVDKLFPKGIDTHRIKHFIKT